MRTITKNELSEIQRKHALWLADEEGGARAYLSVADLSVADLREADLSGANLIFVGQDIRGYLFYAFVGESGAVEIRAGCRYFIGMTAARAHWTDRHEADPILHEDCLSLVDRCERMARVRGWKLEP